MPRKHESKIKALTGAKVKALQIAKAEVERPGDGWFDPSWNPDSQFSYGVRINGNVVNSLKEAGFFESKQDSGGTTLYRITKEGKEALEGSRLAKVHD